jgi:2-polyprenyl-3-methyl-5-hydroxy-6-metoxy-1,4-benzoquinol methylase
MNYIYRNNDIALGNNDLEDLHTFKHFPVFMGCTEQNLSDDILSDMSWKISKNSGMIQLNPLLPLDIVYSAEHGSGTTGKAWDEHHAAFAEFIYKFKPKSILEIGGLHGILAEKYLKLGSNIEWTMVEPNPTVDPNLPIKVIKGFFDDKFISDDKFEAVIHSHVLEHVYDPDEFMSHKSSFMNDGDLLIFTIPNMEVMLTNNYTNCINFEHTVYFTEPYVEYFLHKYGFELVEKQYFKTDHSIFYCAKKTTNIQHFSLQDGLYEKNKSTFQKYINSHINDVNQLNDIINETNSPVYLFGAHVFSQYLISFGLNTSKIAYLLDNDIKKEDKRLYGTSLISKSPKILKHIPNALVILRAGVYNEEIKKDILENINPNVTFI